MKATPIISLSNEKADKPDQIKIAQAVNAVSSFQHLGEVKAVATLAILNGGRTYSAAFSGDRMDRLALIGLLDELKAAMQDAGQPFIERLPGK